MKQYHRYFVYLTVIISVTTFLFFYQFLNVKVNHIKYTQTNVKQHNVLEKETTTMKNQISILIWAPFVIPGEIAISPLCGGKSVTPEGEIVPRCRVTTDRNLFNNSQGIVFMMKKANIKDIPNPNWRRPDQAYVWWCRESSWSTKHIWQQNLLEFNHFFNWTLTHRRDSDINGMMLPYSARKYVETHLEKYQNKQEKHLIRDSKFAELSQKVDYSEGKSQGEVKDYVVNKLIHGKTKSVAWVVSNCNVMAGSKKRMDIANSLQEKGLSVDVYGKCGKLSFPEMKSSNKSAFYGVVAEYRFYLAFPNGYRCRDYLTEKFWFNSLYSGTVPIVWGTAKKDMEDIAPPHSFIHYDDFETEQDLIEYINYLERNVTAYTEYFAWRWLSSEHFPLLGFNDVDEIEMNSFKSPFLNAFCSLCKALSDDINVKYQKTVPSLHDHWFGRDNDICWQYSFP